MIRITYVTITFNAAKGQCSAAGLSKYSTPYY